MGDDNLKGHLRFYWLSGEQILEVLEKRKDFEVILLSGYSKEERLREQAQELNVSYAFNPRGRKSLWANSSTTLITDYNLLEKVILQEVEGVFFAASGIEFLDLFWKLIDTSVSCGLPARKSSF